MAGFINADGSFTMVVSKANKMRLGEKFSIGINIVQQKRSLIALQRAAELLVVELLTLEQIILFNEVLTM
jgi:LAGLIDADG endonuclease